MTTNLKLTPQEILATPMQDNDAEAKTIYQYLQKLAYNVWQENEGFSGKRPFGNSGWEHEVYTALANAGHISSKRDSWGDLEFNQGDADKLMDQALKFLQNADPLSLQLPPEPKEWAVIALDVDEIVGDTLEGFSTYIYTEEEAEKELEKCKKNSPDFTWIKVKLPSYK